MKRFGFHAEHLYFNQRNPSKVRYLKDKKTGVHFEAPMNSKVKDTHQLQENYAKRLEFEKYLAPKGIKPTITSRFPKEKQEVEFLSHRITLARSPKPYDEKTICFRCDPFLSKYEIHQYLTKVYNLPILKLETFNVMGKIMTDRSTRRKWKKQDYKKAIVKLEYEVDQEYQRLMQ